MRLLAFLVFFISGFAALLYQIVWQRLLTNFSGVDVQSATIVVAAFMAGLGCGSLAGGQIADRVSRRRSLLLFVAAELAIAAYGFASVRIIYDVLYQQLGSIDLGPGATTAILFASLLWPTFFMGASLPLLARALTRELGQAASTVGWLYACNTLGAAVGAAFATWWFMPQAGLDGAVRVAAGLNVGCSVLALVCAGAVAGGSAPGESKDSPLPARDGPAAIEAPSAELSFSSTAAVFALSGFLALSFEIVWFRLLGVMLKSTAFTFGTLLAIYLAGLGLGSAAGSIAARRARRPAATFFAWQAGAGLFAAVSLTLFVTRLEKWKPLKWFASYYASDEILDIRRTVLQSQALVGRWLGAAADGDGAWPTAFLALYALLPAVLIGLPTLMMGCSFPLLQKVAQTDLSRLGRRVGILVAANILGSTLGAFVTGLLLLDAVGTSGTLKLLAAASGAFGVLAVWHFSAKARPAIRAAASVSAALATAVVVANIPTSQVLWAALHGASVDRVVMAEDGSGLALVKSAGHSAGGVHAYAPAAVFVNGLGQSWMPYGGIHTVLGALPAFIHPRPRRAAIIGLGSGDTLYGVAGRPEIEHIASIEIVQPQLEVLKQYARRSAYPGVMSLGGRGQIEHVFGDGRLYLRRSTQKFDIIEADALRPTSAYSGNLYSNAFFALLRDRLNPGGLAVSWVPTERVAATFVKVFPYAWRTGDIIIGSNDPIVLDREAASQRLTDPGVERYFQSAGVDISALLRPRIWGAWRRYGPDHDRDALVDINTDLRPRDEFDIPPPFSLKGSAEPR